MNEKLNITPNLQASRDAQSKLAYYIIALCVACIGFSVSQTVGEGLNYQKIPFGCSLVSFGISIYYGLNYIRTIVTVMNWEIHYLKARDNIERGHDDDNIKNQKDWHIYDQQNTTANSMSNDTIKYSSRQRMYFFLGISFFVIWRFLEMYLITASFKPN